MDARALVWPTIGMITAAVEVSTTQMCARTVLQVHTSRGTVLGLTVMRMMMERALSLVRTQIMK
jgi:hypothetical protein